MWTRQTRSRVVRIEQQTKRYPSDLTDAEWERIVVGADVNGEEGSGPCHCCSGAPMIPVPSAGLGHQLIFAGRRLEIL